MPNQNKTRKYAHDKKPPYKKSLSKAARLRFVLQMILNRLCHQCALPRGVQFAESDQGIAVVPIVKEGFHLTNCQDEGFMHSVSQLRKLDLPEPDHSTHSRYQRHCKGLDT